MNQSTLNEFETHIKKIHDELYLFLYKYLKKEDITKDVMQNTLIKAYKNYDSLKDKEKFKSWIFTIGKREALTQIGNINKSKVSYVEEFNLNHVEENIFDLPEEALLNKELVDIVVEAINELDDELKEVVVLKYYNGMSFEDIGKVNATNVSTIRSRHFRAKKYIHKYIMDHYYKD